MKFIKIGESSFQITFILQLIQFTDFNISYHSIKTGLHCEMKGRLNIVISSFINSVPSGPPALCMNFTLDRSALARRGDLTSCIAIVGMTCKMSA